MKPSLRTLALAVIVSLTLACNAITNPQALLRGQATPTLPAEASGGAKLATQLAGTLEPEIEASGVPNLATEVAGTLESETETQPAPKATARPASKATATAAPAKVVTPAAASTPDVNAGIRVANCLSILLDPSAGAETLPSYHLEVKQLSPVMSGGAVAQTEEQISADVAGADVYFIDTTTKPGGKPVVTEAYIIGDQNYTVKDGKITPDYGLSSVVWSSWPISAYFVFAIGSLKAMPAGMETLEGRTAEVYTLAATAADDTTGALAAMGLPVTDVQGQVWIDQATGALLKAVLDYKAKAADNGGSSTDNIGAGRLEITVTQVGQVTVKDPSK
jgi:hypothetical protein